MKPTAHSSTMNKPRSRPRHHTQYVVAIAVILVAGGAGMYFARLGAWHASVSLLALGAFLAPYSLLAAFEQKWTDVYNGAFRAWAQGDSAAAEAALAAVPARARRGWIGVAVESFQATLANEASRFAEAKVLADKALTPRTGFYEWIVRGMRAQFVAVAHGARAVAGAGLSDAAVVQEERAWVDSEPFVPANARARVLFAETVLAAQKDDRVLLTARVRRLSPQSEHLVPRERVVLRALRRLVQQAPGAVYRERSQVVEATEAAQESALRDWVTRLVPRATDVGLDDLVSEAAARTAPTDADLQLPELSKREAATAKERLASAVKGKGQKKRLGRPAVTLMLWVILIALFLAIYRMLSPVQESREAPGRAHVTESVPAAETSNASGIMGAFSTAMVLLVVVALFATLRARMGSIDKMARISSLLASDDPEAGMRALDVLVAKARLPATRALALANRATERERRARFNAALRDCEEITALYQSSPRSQTGDTLYLPLALSQRAFVLAVLGKQHEDEKRLDESAEIMRAVNTSFPDFVLAQVHRFRVALVAALARSDYARASRIAASRPASMPLSYRDELLADLVLLATQGGTDEGVHGLLSEIERAPFVPAWLESVAPEVLTAVRARARLD